MTTMNVNLPLTRDAFSRAFGGLRNWMARMRTRAELERLSERELYDIGLMRADIDDVVNGRA
ncbi:Uncharacterized conserved protein YjiS, DUF1127 family [Paracoccus isoporae]|uniref:Uncharacterized conserved protein YjiS, DUF1127 family n=1 Tax=Paracoccus isoporae TaxID=591205 RepID=A0A1G7EKC1_9RHOB|nr:DUF1127 domain-containing protein [Paracoccus isoporae]SDE64037.1 Uncharacterized conserved protein YjiS, DUF1127 family [Paracoccus isoporae]